VTESLNLFLYPPVSSPRQEKKKRKKTVKQINEQPLYVIILMLEQYILSKFVSDLQQVSGFFQVLRFPPPIKLAATL
jgi:transcription antitermination factor NusG